MKSVKLRKTIENQMEEKVTVDGLTFVPYLRREEIQKEVARVASERRVYFCSRPHSGGRA